MKMTHDFELKKRIGKKICPDEVIVAILLFSLVITVAYASTSKVTIWMIHRDSKLS